MRDDLLAALNAGETITGDSPLHAVMHRTSQEALRITGELNGGYHEPERVRELLAERIFINSGCKFQDQGGVVIGDDCLIGHNTVLATLNHDLAPSRRADMHPAPIVIGRNVWIGANVTVLPGVTIGDNAVVAAASVVKKDVPENSVVVGSPARVVRSLTG
ncbi:MAG: sugar O-acetyltransferase [Actinomycetota bacterium]|nr:sugar O-acetyltransferase [Actinomycetota bacterium]